MELTILHLYPELMDLYGEYANAEILRRRLELLGVSAAVKKNLCEDAPDFAGADLIYMGAGTEGAQKYALSLLAPYGEALRSAAGSGTPILFTGNAMELLGASVTDAEGTLYPCLGLADYVTVETRERVPGDVVARSALWDAPAVGFMNKCSVTSGVSAPLFPELMLGLGNERERGPEGYVSGSIFATHVTGPVLVKNPDFTDLLLRRVLARAGLDAPESLPALPHEREAHAATLRELRARIRQPSPTPRSPRPRGGSPR